MLTKLTPQTDTQLSQESAVNIVLTEALAQIAALTNLTEQQCADLLHEKLKAKCPEESYSNHEIRSASPIINRTESNFIFAMFN